MKNHEEKSASYLLLLFRVWISSSSSSFAEVNQRQLESDSKGQ